MRIDADAECLAQIDRGIELLCSVEIIRVNGMVYNIHRYSPMIRR